MASGGWGRGRLAAAVVWAVLMVTGAAAQEEGGPGRLSVETAPLHVEIKGKDYALDTLVMRRRGADMLPVALMTDGSSAGGPRLMQMDSISLWVDQFARRGWLAVGVMRRGYGHSDGELIDNSGSCAAPAVGDYLERQADDLQATLDAIGKRPDADMSQVLLMGQSAGGATVMALAARLPSRVAAVVNVSGGLLTNGGDFRLDPDCEADRSDLVWNFARFGKTAHMPTLWLYAENDGFFSPGLVARMRSAFVGAGGKAELVMLPPFGADGHTMFYAPGGPQRLLPPVDRFLRGHGLPTWDEAPFASLSATLSPQSQNGLEYYLQSLPTEKALALGPNGLLYWRYRERDALAARQAALAACEKQAGAACRLVAQDFQPIPPASSPAAPVSQKESPTAPPGG